MLHQLSIFVCLACTFVFPPLLWHFAGLCHCHHSLIYICIIYQMEFCISHSDWELVNLLVKTHYVQTLGTVALLKLSASGSDYTIYAFCWYYIPSHRISSQVGSALFGKANPNLMWSVNHLLLIDWQWMDWAKLAPWGEWCFSALGLNGLHVKWAQFTNEYLATAGEFCLCSLFQSSLPKQNKLHWQKHSFASITASKLWFLLHSYVNQWSCLTMLLIKIAFQAQGDSVGLV